MMLILRPIIILLAIILSFSAAPSNADDTWVVWTFTIDNNTNQTLRLEFSTLSERIIFDGTDITNTDEHIMRLYDSEGYPDRSATVELGYRLVDQIEFDDVIVCAKDWLKERDYGCKMAYADRFSQTITFNESDGEDTIEPEPDPPEQTDPRDSDEDHHHDDNESSTGAGIGCFMDGLLF